MKKYLGVVFFMVYTISFVIIMTKILPESKPPTQGIPNNYWVPTTHNITHVDSIHKLP